MHIFFTDVLIRWMVYVEGEKVFEIFQNTCCFEADKVI